MVVLFHGSHYFLLIDFCVYFILDVVNFIIKISSEKIQTVSGIVCI